MKKLSVMSVFGTRPEAVKMAPLIKELEKYDEIKSVVCVTAQHRQMLDQVLELFHIEPQFDLNIMQDRQTLTSITTRVLEGMEDVLETVKPDIVLVHGDTTTSFVVALAAFYKQIKVGHVEAGLRTHNKYEPFPEEMNRKLTGSLTDLHFSPTALARENLRSEGVEDAHIYVTGNTVIDALKHTIEEDYQFSVPQLNDIAYHNRKVLTVTAHRRENLGKPLEHICEAILQVVEDYPEVEVVYAVHKNPAVREVVYRILGNSERVHLIEPLDLKDMHNLLKRSYLVLTDSGGLQEEVPSLGKPVLVLRNVTERPEGIEAGTLKLAGVEKQSIYELTKQLLDDKTLYQKMAQAKNPFGDGNASERIIQSILYEFGYISHRPKDYCVTQ